MVERRACSLVIFTALLSSQCAAAEVDADTLQVIDEARLCMRLTPLSPSHPSARRRSKGVPAEPRERKGLIAHVRRLLSQLRWVMSVIVAYRLLKRSLDRFLPIPEDDETDALDYVDFEKFLYEEEKFPSPGEITRLPLSS